MKNPKNFWTVYCHTTPSGKRYIGITSKENAEKRWRDGKGYDPETPFGKAIEKYKWENIQHNILFNDLTEKEAKWLENYLICYYRTFVGFKDDCKGYNCTLGGDGLVGWHPTNETKEKMSESKKGKPSPWKGKHPSEETRRRMSESKKGKPSPKKGIKTGKPAWNRGIPRDDETRRKISESHKGQIPWNIGISPTEETRIKSSESHKGQIPWNIGIPHKEETKIRISMSKKGKPSNTKGMHRVYHEDGTFHMER